MKLLIKWICYALAIVFIAWLLPGIEVSDFISALLVAVVLGLINVFLKPLLFIITLPINIITLGLFSLIINAFLLWLAGYVSPGFEVDGFWSALFGSIILSVLSTAINSMSKD